MTEKIPKYKSFICKPDGTYYGDYYGNGLYGADKNKYKENQNINGTPLWIMLIAFCCMNA